MKLWLEQRAAELPRKSSLAEAVGYALNQWDGLVRFLDDGRIEINSNTVERSMRPIALNRKNALFAGHDLGAENWAVLASLIETCKLHGVNPEAWLADVLTKLVNNWPNRRLAELTPWAWQAAQNTPERAAASAALPKRPRSNLQPSSKRKAGAPEAPLTITRPAGRTGCRPARPVRRHGSRHRATDHRDRSRRIRVRPDHLRRGSLRVGGDAAVRAPTSNLDLIRRLLALNDALGGQDNGTALL